MIKHVIFDLGNVLIDIHPEKTLKALSAHSALPYSQVEKLFLSESHLQLMSGELSPFQFYENFIRRFRTAIGFEEFIDIWNRLIGSAKPGIAELVNKLSHQYTLSICSNTDPNHWDTAQKQCDFISAFKYFFLSYDLKCVKPSPKIFVQMLDFLAANPSECIFIDDTLANVCAARNLKINSFQASNSLAIITKLEKYCV